MNPTGAAFLARRKHSSVLSPSTGIIYTFGGVNPTAGFKVLSDMWQFDTSNGAWTPITYTGSSFPCARKSHSAVIDSSGVFIYVIAGQLEFTGTLTDTWRFHITSSKYSIIYLFSCSS